MIWRPASDTFSFRYDEEVGNGPWTKLGVLKLYMSLLDPLGALLPYVMSARILYLDLWEEGCEWNKQLSEEAARGWAAWFRQLEQLNELEFPRCINLTDDDRLTVFTHASQDAYGAMCYAYGGGRAVCYAYGGGRAVLLYARDRINAKKRERSPFWSCWERRWEC